MEESKIDFDQRGIQMNDQEKLLKGFGLATTPVCGAHKYRSEWLTLDTHFVKTLVMVFVVHFVLCWWSAPSSVSIVSLWRSSIVFVCLFVLCGSMRFKNITSAEGSAACAE